MEVLWQRSSLGPDLLATLSKERDSFFLLTAGCALGVSRVVYRLNQTQKLGHKFYGVLFGEIYREQSGMQQSAASPLGPGRNKQPDINTKLKLVQLSYRVISVSRSPFKAVPLV